MLVQREPACRRHLALEQLWSSLQHGVTLRQRLHEIKCRLWQLATEMFEDLCDGKAAAGSLVSPPSPLPLLREVRAAKSVSELPPKLTEMAALIRELVEANISRDPTFRR